MWVRLGELGVQIMLVALVVTAPTRAAAPWVITQDTTLDPARTYGPILVKASHITIDGRGAWLIGAEAQEPHTFQGTAISAAGVSHVTLKNIRAKGWERGLHIRRRSGLDR